MSILVYPLNGIDYDAEDAETYLCTRTSGVWSSDDNLAVRVTGDRQLTVYPGLAWVRNKGFAGKSLCLRLAQTLTVPVASGSQSRVDRLVLRFDKALNAAALALVQGDYSSNPVAKAVTQTELLYELGLCTIRVRAGTASLAASDITDTRTDEKVCGLMRDGVTGLPSAQFYAQMQALIDELRAAIDATYQEDSVKVKDHATDAEINDIVASTAV